MAMATDPRQEPDPSHPRNGRVHVPSQVVPQADRFYLCILLSKLNSLPLPEHSDQSLAGPFAKVSALCSCVIFPFFSLDTA